MNVPSAKKAVILFSGGLDSATCLQVARRDGFAPHCLTFDYGQRHKVEIDAAQRIAVKLGVPHQIQRLELGELLQSSLTGHGAVPKSRDLKAISHVIPSTYVPARNIIFLSIALGYAESIGARDIYFGANSLDYSGYPDCRPEFLEAFETMAERGTKWGSEGGKLKIHTPLLKLTKAQIVNLALALGVDVAATHSCYDPQPNGKPCGACDSCLLRAKGLAEAQYENGVTRP